MSSLLSELSNAPSKSVLEQWLHQSLLLSLPYLSPHTPLPALSTLFSSPHHPPSAIRSMESSPAHASLVATLASSLSSPSLSTLATHLAILLNAALSLSLSSPSTANGHQESLLALVSNALDSSAPAQLAPVLASSIGRVLARARPSIPLPSTAPRVSEAKVTVIDASSVRISFGGAHSVVVGVELVDQLIAGLGSIRTMLAALAD